MQCWLRNISAKLEIIYSMHNILQKKKKIACTVLADICLQLFKCIICKMQKNNVTPISLFFFVWWKYRSLPLINRKLLNTFLILLTDDNWRQLVFPARLGNLPTMWYLNAVNRMRGDSKWNRELTVLTLSNALTYISNLLEHLLILWVLGLS